MHVMSVDEIGDPGRDALNDPHFGLTSAITEYPSPFEDIARMFLERWSYTELKAKDASPEERDAVLNRISEEWHETYTVYIDKNAEDNPYWWKKYDNRNSVYRRVLRELMDHTFSATENDDLLVILDEHDAIIKGQGEQIIMDSAKRNGKNVIACYAESSQHGEHGHILQATDFLPRGIRDMINGKANTFSLNISPKRLTRDNVAK
jgi:hypothetical protein